MAGNQKIKNGWYKRREDQNLISEHFVDNVLHNDKGPAFISQTQELDFIIERYYINGKNINPNGPKEVWKKHGKITYVID